MELFLAFIGDLCGVIGGFILGILVHKIWSRWDTIGTLRVDHSDDDGPYLFLELDKPVDFLEQDQRVMFKVNIEDYLPRE